MSVGNDQPGVGVYWSSSRLQQCSSFCWGSRKGGRRGLELHPQLPLPTTGYTHAHILVTIYDYNKFYYRKADCTRGFTESNQIKLNWYCLKRWKLPRWKYYVTKTQMLQSEDRDQHVCRNSKKSCVYSIVGYHYHIKVEPLKSRLSSSVSSQLHWSEGTGRTVLSFPVHWTGWLADWRDWRPLLVGQLVFKRDSHNMQLIIRKWSCWNQTVQFLFSQDAAEYFKKKSKPKSFLI